MTKNFFKFCQIKGNATKTLCVIAIILMLTAIIPSLVSAQAKEQATDAYI